MNTIDTENKRKIEAYEELVDALRDLFQSPTGSPGVDRIELAKAWHRARDLMCKLGEM
jgi:hypothetical protein